MNKPPLESVIVRDIMKALRAKGLPVWKINGNGYQTKGLPDLITIAPNGRFVGLEVKRPRPSGYGATALQEKTLRDINAAGGIGMIVRSVAGAEAAIGMAEFGWNVEPGDDLQGEEYV